MANNESFQGVSHCFVFKSRLQEYAQKCGYPSPVYETIKEGPPHEPTFRSTVILNNVRYDSLPGFYSRKQAEQSAAEVAVKKVLENGFIRGLNPPVHETGLCKNVLQEYAQKMNFAIPRYECLKYDTSSYSCTVEIGGMRYIGGEAKTKKEAEIKAARTAMFAIQSSGLEPNEPDGSPYSVIPPKKRVTDLDEEKKPKKARFIRKKLKKLSGATKQNLSENVCDLEVKTVNQAVPDFHENAAVSTQGVESGITPIAATADVLIPCNNWDSNEQKAVLNVNHNGCGTLTLGINSQSGGGGMTEVNAATEVVQVTSEVDSSALYQGDVHGDTSCLEQETACGTDADQGRSTTAEAEAS